MSDEVATAGAIDAETPDYGRVYEVEDRFLVVPPPKERGRVFVGVTTIVVLIATWYFVTLEDRTFADAKLANSTPVFQAYLAEYPAGKYVDDANAGIDDIFWEERRQARDYTGYLAKYPAGRHAGSADQALDDVAYQEQKKIGTIQSYQAYLQQYQKGRHSKGALLAIERITNAQFNNCMNTCVTSKGEPDPKKNFAEECCAPVCGGDWAEDKCAQAKNEDGTLKSPPVDAPGVTPNGVLPPPPPLPVAPGAPGGAAPGSPAPAPAPAGN